MANCLNWIKPSNWIAVLVVVLLAFISGCVSQPNKPNLTEPPSLYDSVIYHSQTEQTISLNQIADQLRDMDVVFLGEYHGHQASHWLQAKIQTALYQKNPQQVLTMEQFETDHQQDLDAYLDSEIGEKTFIKQADAWSNYTASYRPLVEFAKQEALPVIAANAPKAIVRCIGRQGKAYLQKLNAEELASIAQHPFLSDTKYEKKFSQFQKKVKHGQASSNSYYAQLLRDNTMAEAILQAREDFPNHQILHTNGAFHSDEFLGTVALLLKRDPTLKVAVVSPVMKETLETPLTLKDFNKGSFVYVLLPLPEEYVLAENRRKGMKEMFSKAKQKKCK